MTSSSVLQEISAEVERLFAEWSCRHSDREGGTCCAACARAMLHSALLQSRHAQAEIEGLQREKAEDAWHRGWQVAVAERDEARRQLDAVKAKLEAAEARAEAAESQLAIAEEGRLSALRHCARLEDALASPVRDAGEGEQA